MILLARIEDMRTAEGGKVLVTAGYWVDAPTPVSGSVVVLRVLEPADAMRSGIATACVLAAAADFGIDPADLSSATVL